MAKECRDFIYQNKALSTMGYTCVNFESDSDIPLFLEREITKGETTEYRVKANHLGAKWTNTIELEFNILRRNYSQFSQADLEISRDEIRNLSKWLTSTSLPSMMSVAELDGAETYFCGIFTKIDTFCVGSRVYGLKLTFANDSPFAYTDEITNNVTVKGLTPFDLTNNSDLLDDYCYPTLCIYPNAKSDFYLVNLSDCAILDEGKITVDSNADTTFTNFLAKIEAYALKNQYTDVYYYDHKNKYITLANNTAIRVKLVESTGIEHYCFAYHDKDGNYKIIEDGFFSLSLLKDLPVTANCDLLTINDDLGRMILFERIGIEDVDYIYWPRLKSGKNSLLFFANNCSITITRREMLKVGAV